MNINVKKIIKNTSLIACTGAFVIALIPGCTASQYLFSSQNKGEFNAHLSNNEYFITADDGDQYKVTREKLDELNLPLNCEEPLFLSYDEEGNTVAYAVTKDLLNEKESAKAYNEKMNSPEYDKVFVRKLK